MPQAAKRAQSPVERATLLAIRGALASREDHMSQNALARAAGMSTSQLSAVMTGRKPALFTEVVALADVLGIDLPTLVEHAQRQASSVAGPDPAIPLSAEVADIALQVAKEARRNEDHRASGGCEPV